MKVILRENVENLGRIGDVVKVSEGYARNYLLPRNLVVIADEQNQAALDHHKRSMERRRLRSLKDLQAVAERIGRTSCILRRKAGEGEKLFGSVTAADVAHSLETQGIQIDKRTVVLDEPIKQLGQYSILVRLAPEVTASLKVAVQAE